MRSELGTPNSELAQDDRREVREKLDRVLRSGEYDSSGEEKAEPERPRCSAQPRVELPGGASKAGHVVFYAVAGAAVVALVAYVVWRLSRIRRKPKDEDKGVEKKIPDEPDAMMKHAEEEAAQSRYTEAIRFCHRASLLGMDRRRVVRFKECLTSGDYRRQLGGRPERQDFDSLAAIFERAYFGKLPAAEAEYLECRRAALALMEEAGT